MTRQQAKEIALSLCRPFRGLNPLQEWATMLQADYAARTEQVILATLHDIMSRTPGAVVTRVHDTFIIETQSEPQAQQIAIDFRVTQHGVIIEPPKSFPLVASS